MSLSGLSLVNRAVIIAYGRETLLEQVTVDTPVDHGESVTLDVAYDIALDPTVVIDDTRAHTTGSHSIFDFGGAFLRLLVVLGSKHLTTSATALTPRLALGGATSSTTEEAPCTRPRRWSITVR